MAIADIILAPCHYCGAEVATIALEKAPTWMNKPGMMIRFVVCHNCGARGPIVEEDLSPITRAIIIQNSHRAALLWGIQGEN
jgi:hypothetical protein